MLKNKKVVYFCQECGYESSKWMGQCPGCRAWNTFVEETVSTKKVSSTGSGLQNGLRRAEPVVLKDIRLSEDERKLTNIGELDRVLGGGIVPGQIPLVPDMQCLWDNGLHMVLPHELQIPAFFQVLFHFLVP